MGTCDDGTLEERAVVRSAGLTTRYTPRVLIGLPVFDGPNNGDERGGRGSREAASTM